MRNKIGCISFYFSAFIFLLLIGSCVTSGTLYYPKSLATTPSNKLVKVIIPASERIKMIDGNKVNSAQTLYVLPGNHTYTFKIKYRSSTYCNGPSYGLKAERDYVLKDGQVSSVITMGGEYKIDVSAGEGETVKFIFKEEPDCKSKIYDYFKVVVSK